MGSGVGGVEMAGDDHMRFFLGNVNPRLKQHDTYLLKNKIYHPLRAVLNLRRRIDLTLPAKGNLIFAKLQNQTM